MPKASVPPSQLAAMSVQDRARRGFMEDSPLTFNIARVADEIPPYGSSSGPWDRDKHLDDFWKTEPILAGAVYSMCAKVAALDFELKGPDKAVTRYRNVMYSADLGTGWVNFCQKVSQDIFCLDNGSFIELLRPTGSTATTPVYGIAHLDSQRCRRTGTPDTPVRYRTVSRGNKYRSLKWWEVVSLADLPSPREELKGIGYCAVSRILRAAQVLRDIGIRKRQKLAGKRVPAILFVQGIRRGAVKEALEQTMEEQMNRGESHYTAPAIIASPDPARPVDVELIELAGLPDGYDEDTTLKWYIATLALGFGTDYTEFAPLPGGGLGTATQSTEMAARARGKGPGVILQQLEFAINWFILPESIEFQFASTDPIAEQEKMQQRLLRGRDRAVRLYRGELTPEQALKLAVADGDAPAEFLEEEAAEPTQVDLLVRQRDELKRSYIEVENKILKLYHPQPYALINGRTGEVLDGPDTV